MKKGINRSGSNLASRLFVIVVMTLVYCVPASAAIYKGIKPGLSFNDVQAMFPGGSFQEVKVVWSKTNQRLYSLTGGGIAGEIMIMFERYTPHKPKDEAARIWYKNLPDRTALRVEWTQWIPETPLEINQVVAVYGKKYKREVNKAEFFSFLNWGDGFTARLDPSGKKATVLEFMPSPRESYWSGFFQAAILSRKYDEYLRAETSGVSAPATASATIEPSEDYR